MKTRLILFFAAMAAALFFTACQSEKETKVYDFTAIANDGSEVNFADYKGRVVARYEPMVTPEELAAYIEEQL